MRLKTTLLVTTVLLTKMALPQNTADIFQYINTYKDLAISEMQRSGIPSAIILAQGIHETEAGTSELVKKSNNHFGIKCKVTWAGSVVYHDDDERGECFRSYSCSQDSYKDHSDFLKASPRYAFLFKLDPMDYSSWAYGLKKAGYATNVRYPQILIKLIEDYDLQQYTMVAMGMISADSLRQVAPIKSNLLSPNNGAPANPPSVPSAVPTYPDGIFEINKARVVFARAGASLLFLAEQYSLSLSRLLDFNDLDDGNVLAKDQLLYLQRKRKISDHAFHLVKLGETLYDICQSEGVRLESIQEMNQLARGAQPAAGDKIYLQPLADR